MNDRKELTRWSCFTNPCYCVVEGQEHELWLAQPFLATLESNIISK